MGKPATTPPPPGGKREHNKAENRAAILAAARKVFVKLGYEAATVRDVIGATDLAAGTFYNYFRDKESVLRALLDEKMEEMQRRTREARRDALTVEDVVRSSLRLSFEMVAEDREVFELLQRNAGAVRAILDEPSFVANREELRRDLERALRRDGTRGVDGEYLAAAIGGLAFEVAACAVDRKPRALETAAEFAISLVLEGLVAMKSRDGKPRARRRQPSPTVPACPRTSRETTAVSVASRTTGRKPS